jgi:hypothetical protein
MFRTKDVEKKKRKHIFKFLAFSENRAVNETLGGGECFGAEQAPQMKI